MLFIVDSLESGFADPFCGFDLSLTLTTMTARRKSENLMGMIKEVDGGDGADTLVRRTRGFCWMQRDFCCCRQADKSVFPRSLF
jgi:hypothetical protein